MIQKCNSVFLAFLCFCSSLFYSCQHLSKKDFITVFEESKGRESAAYEEGIAWWKKLDDAFSEVSMEEAGLTDEGLPLHIIWIGDEESTLDKRKKPVLFINNAIHPGEPDGVDASMLLIRDLLMEPAKRPLLDKVQIAVIPYYNIGGARNRNSHSRANQLGPLNYGFRGNAMNLDLNRDFIKEDALNTASFARLFHRFDPDLYIETHVSNGADYRHTMTCLPTLYQKLDTPLSLYFKTNIEEEMYRSMRTKDQDMVPYVNVFNTPPDSGMQVFIDGPRYSSGYAALFQTPGFITETLMLKPFNERVKATYDFLWCAIEILSKEGNDLMNNRRKARAGLSNLKEVNLDWKVNEQIAEFVPFKGYKAVYRWSEITGDTVLTYDRDEPVDLMISYFREVTPTLVKKLPQFYILENGFHKVKERLQTRNVNYRALPYDTVMTVTLMKISSYETAGEPYEGHYFHHHSTYEEINKQIRIPAGSWLIPARQNAARYLAEVFFPDAPDSYFNWNYFDTRLQQKEWYSTYVFEPKAKEMLHKDSLLRKDFENKIAQDSAFAANPHERLYYLYQKSPHYEWHHKVMPVYLLY